MKNFISKNMHRKSYIEFYLKSSCLSITVYGNTFPAKLTLPNSITGLDFTLRMHARLLLHFLIDGLATRKAALGLDDIDNYSTTIIFFKLLQYY